ncbi:PHA/PHB synthase family protein [Rhodosalinus sediminis]|uniref:PHA/PHB synthase family protein n=1 Tax=Rhodosalinus sediminis TaxID=1940533 RepID=UPI0023574DEC|nr:class I poly(R)-hydroxyalkanoic acid synthase [Rhodosalinus sediminis]
MTTDDDAEIERAERMQENLQRIEELTQRLIRALGSKPPSNPGLNAPGGDLYAKAAAAWWVEWMQNPGKLLEQQIAWWGKSLSHWIEAQKQLAHGQLEPPEDDTPEDPRFANPLWKTHPYFNFVKQQYMIYAQAVDDAVSAIDDLDETEKRRLRYFSRQIVEMMAPTNYFGTNPDALERAIETEGESLVKGLENLVADLEANEGELVVRLADERAFKVGENIGTSPGKVVYRNRMMELIQYAPATEQQRETPLLIFPPWINKFYILDLKAKNSLVKWLTEQGYTLYMVSWINPGPSYADVGLEEYVDEGFLTAIREVKAMTGQARINVVGYCIAGTTLALTLSLMKKRGDTSVKSATFLTALTDFSDQGEFTPFLQDDFVDAIEGEARDAGVLPSHVMARTFSFLRSRDLVYGPAIKSYMMGETPPAFDLLYWNGDGANLPAKMAIQYLRRLCQDNAFAEEGFELFGERLRLRDVDVPLCSVACETDHIAAWKDCYRGVQGMGSRSKTFILSQSGHIAGVVNPPTKNKYGHYTNADLKLDHAAWRESAAFHEGSWWPRWDAWLAKRSGKWVPAREPGDSEHPPLADAPGTYVVAPPTD